MINEKERNVSLDVIRAVSMPIIIFFHYNCATTRIISKDVFLLKGFGYAGLIGVSMFLILSGAGLTLSTKQNFRPATFFKKRFLAIYPLFWTVYILFVLGGILLGIDLFADRRPAPASFIYTILAVDGLMTYRGPNYYLIGEWFLGCILILYLLYPIIRYLIDLNRHLVLLACLTLCLILGKTYHLGMPLSWFPLYRLFEFVFGMYFISLNTQKSRPMSLLLLSGTGAGILAIFLSGIRGSGFIPTIGLGTLCFVFTAGLSDLTKPQWPMFKKAVRFLSRYSYAAFLLHHLMLVQIVKTLPDYLTSPYYNWTVFGLTLVLVYIAAYVVDNAVRWLLIRPVAALKKTYY